MAMKSGDTAHLYDGKTVRSSAPSAKETRRQMHLRLERFQKMQSQPLRFHRLSKAYLEGRWSPR